MNRMIVSLSAAALLALAAGMSQAQSEKPDATVDYSGNSVAAGIGYTWGHGVLHYDGMDYPFSANGLSAVSVGGALVTASGNVYYLTKVEDFPGRYIAATAGATVGPSGAGWTALRNQNGVVVEVQSTSQGLELDLAVSGIDVAFSGPPTPMPAASLAEGSPSR